ncbi:MAG: endonuclease/exonuclease/phosphatase family protein [Sphingomonadaceae bacterium]
MKLRCLTLNIWKNEGRFDQRLAAIADGLKRLDPDIVALQECFRATAGGIDAAARLASATGHVLSRFPLRRKLRPHQGQIVDSYSDLAILTRAPPQAAAIINFPQDRRDGERGLLIADLIIADRPLRVACAHFTHLRDGKAEAVRREQAIAALVALQIAPNRPPVILMGDLNAPCDDASLSPLFDHPLLDPSSRRLASQPRGGVTDGVIDHILSFGGAPGLRMASRTLALRPDPSDPEAGPSDHPAIIAELETA